ncbi:MAG: hypothetical protein P8I34_04105, partial [Flavobacteriaceae bacterium]|nr:hypothetical protein [Flavobacteriaceae bacterium]
MRVKSILLFLALHITLFSFSQQGINYQAIVKDSDGMILKDSDVSIKFSLIYEDVNSTPIYIEEHQITTPSDGIVNIYIGSGTKLTTGVDFSEIDWSQNVFLKEELDTSGNYETMGTNQIASVPVAEFSRNTASIFTTSNTIQLGNDNIELVNTSGVVSATGFVGDGSRLTNVGLGGSIDENGNLKIVDHSPTTTTSQTNNVLIGSGVALDLTDGSSNVAIGANTMKEISFGENNVAIGPKALMNVANRPSTNQIINDGLSGIEEFRNLSDNPSTTLNEAALGIPGNIAIGAGAYASPQTSTSTYTEISQSNISIGHMSMYNATKSTGSNIALGSYTLPVLEQGGGNITMGWAGLKSLQNGNANIAIGQNAMENSITVKDNVAIGRLAMQNSTYSDKNTAIGNYALRRLGSTLDQLNEWQQEGDEIYSHMNTAVGHAPLIFLTEGNFNTAFGALSLYNLKVGYRNATVGFHTLYHLEGGQENTAIGDGAGYGTTGTISRTTLIGAATRITSGIENSTALGYSANVTTSNTIQLGNDNIELINTSGIVSATGFVGDGSGLKNVNLSGSIDENGNLVIVDQKPTMTTSQTNNILLGAGVAPNLTDGQGNIAIGMSSMASATTTFGNVAIGPNTLSSVTLYDSNESSTESSSALNIAIGPQTLMSLEEGYANIAQGNNALRNVKEG